MNQVVDYIIKMISYKTFAVQVFGDVFEHLAAGLRTDKINGLLAHDDLA